MSDRFNRRDILKMSGAGITVTGFYSSVAGAEEQTSEKEGYGQEKVPSDLTIINNGTKEHPVRIKIFENEGDKHPIFSRTFTLNGLNNQKSKKDNQFKFDGKIDASGKGVYHVEGNIPQGQNNEKRKDTTGIILNGDGVDDYYKLVSYVSPENEFEIYTCG